jgi:hypothetical protein
MRIDPVEFGAQRLMNQRLQEQCERPVVRVAILFLDEPMSFVRRL